MTSNVLSTGFRHSGKNLLRPEGLPLITLASTLTAVDLYAPPLHDGSSSTCRGEDAELSLPPLQCSHVPSALTYDSSGSSVCRAMDGTVPVEFMETRGAIDEQSRRMHTTGEGGMLLLCN